MKTRFKNVKYFFIFLFFNFSALAQETVNSKYIDKKGRNIRYNIIKTNLLGWPAGMQNIAYERKLGKKYSFQIEIVLFSKPLLSNLIERSISNNNPNIDFKFSSSGFALSPELRWYLGRNGSPRGYYFGIYVPIINYKTNFDVSSLQSQVVTDNANSISQTINTQTYGNFSPSFTYYGLGLSGGPQFLIGNRISLEFYLNLSLGLYTLSDKQLFLAGRGSTALPTQLSATPTGNYTAAQLATIGINVDNSPNYSYAIENSSSGKQFVANYKESNDLKELKEFETGIIVVPRIGFSLGYAFGR